MNKEDLIGKKVRGFKFEGDYNIVMDKNIGEVGTIIAVSPNRKRVMVKYVNYSWIYPTDQIENHLVK